MIKKVVLLVTLLMYFMANPSFAKEGNDQVFLSKVYKTNVLKDQMYDKILEWMAINYVSSNDVIQYKDKVLGVIVGKGITDYSINGFFTAMIGMSQCRYTMKVRLKDYKYKVTFSNYVHINSDGLAPDYALQKNDKGKIKSVEKELLELADNMYEDVCKDTVDDF